MARLGAGRAVLSAVQQQILVLRSDQPPSQQSTTRPSWEIYHHVQGDQIDRYTWRQFGPRDYRPIPIADTGGGGQIIRSAIAPTSSLTQPDWEKWYQETPRTIRQFTYINVGGRYHPYPIPWCCGDPDQYDRFKPFSIDRVTEAPVSSNSPPIWQLRTVETANQLRRYTWAESSGEYIPVEIPWATRAVGRNLAFDTILEKPQPGDFDEPTNTTESLFERSVNAPSSSTTRPTWEYLIQESETSLRLFTHAKIGEQYEPISLPWGQSFNSASGALIDEYELEKSTPTNWPNIATTEMGDVIHRSASQPIAQTGRPHWELWIQESDTFLRWYTHAFIDGQYRPITLPWIISFDRATSTFNYEYELSKS